MAAAESDRVTRLSPRAPLQRALDDAESRTLADLQFIRSALGASVRHAIDPSSAAASAVWDRLGQAAGRYDDLHRRLLAVIACQAPVAGDLRLVLALLQVNDRIQRIAAQCASLLALRREITVASFPSWAQVRCLLEMARLADEQIVEAARVLAERDGAGAERLRARDRAVNAHNLRCFELAVRAQGGLADRETALVLVLMARALERAADNAVDIAHQVAFLRIRRVEASARAAGAPVARDGGALSARAAGAPAARDRGALL